jgi:hypothetical protein
MVNGEITTMKYLSMLCILLIISPLFFGIARADPTILIESYELTPEVLMPGDLGILRLTVKNAETTNTIQKTTTSGSDTTIRTDTVGATINNIWIVAAEDGTKKVKATDNYEDIGDLAPASSITVDFKIQASENITEGIYIPTVRIDVQTYQDVQYPIPIQVSNETVDLLLTDVPSKISISGSTLFTFTAINRRENTVEEVTIVPLDTSLVSYSPNNVYIGSLEADASSEASFSIQPNELGRQNLSFEIHFENGDNEHIETISIPVEVIELLDVAPVFINIPSQVEKGKSSRVTLEVYNAKSESISGVIVTPLTEAAVSPSQYYIGSMDADDVFSATFDVSADGLDYGNYSLAFKVSFKQGSSYYETPTISSSFEVIPLSNSASGSGLLLTVGVVVLLFIFVVLVYFIWWKRRTNK